MHALVALKTIKNTVHYMEMTAAGSERSNLRLFLVCRICTIVLVKTQCGSCFCFLGFFLFFCF